MTAYCFFDVQEVKDPVKLDAYRAGVLDTVQAHGGRYLTVGGQMARVEGDWQPVYPVLIEFPSLSSAYAWYRSPQYQDLKAMRLAATRGHAVFIEGTGFRTT